MSTKCIIKFDNENGIFFAGQTLKGTVQLTLSSAQKFRALRLTIYGDAKCKWSEKLYHSIPAITMFFCLSKKAICCSCIVRITLRGQEVYLNTKYNLFDSFDGELIEYAAGVHCFNFESLLPLALPSSIHGTHGSIHYNVEAELDIPRAFDKKIQATFCVVRPEDLNLWPHLQTPREAHMRKKFLFFPFMFGQGAMLIQATIPVQGFIPGETIPVKVEINNTTDVAVAYTKLALQRTTEYIVDKPHMRSKRETEKKFVFVKGSGFKSHSAGKIIIPFTVPNTTCSNEHTSRYIKVSYKLAITCKVRGLALSPKLYIPITIGSIPFAANSHLHDAKIFPSSAPTAPTELPPSFEVATGQFDKNIEAGQPQENNYGWNNSMNSSNTPLTAGY